MNYQWKCIVIHMKIAPNGEFLKQLFRSLQSNHVQNSESIFTNGFKILDAHARKHVYT